MIGCTIYEDSLLSTSFEIKKLYFDVPSQVYFFGFVLYIAGSVIVIFKYSTSFLLAV